MITNGSQGSNTLHCSSLQSWADHLTFFYQPQLLHLRSQQCFILSKPCLLAYWISLDFNWILNMAQKLWETHWLDSPFWTARIIGVRNFLKQKQLCTIIRTLHPLQRLLKKIFQGPSYILACFYQLLLFSIELYFKNSYIIQKQLFDRSGWIRLAL